VQAFLLMNAGANSGARFELDGSEKNLLGRDWECRVVLNDPQCSRFHAEVYYDEDGWWVRDKKSSNGTYVNGQTVDSAQLVEGTQLRIGASSFTFSIEADRDKGAPDAGVQSDSKDFGDVTIVLDESMNPQETGQYTLDFLKGHNWGKDFFFLFQLSVKLLAVDEPDKVIRICIKRLFDRTMASAAGFLWVSDDGVLSPRVIYPEAQSDLLALNKDLTARVVSEKRAMRIEQGSSLKKNKSESFYSDSICVPLISEGTVKGAIHLYRKEKPFSESHFELAIAMANIMIRSLDRAHRLTSLAAENDRLVQKSATFDELKGESAKMLELKSKIKKN